MRQLRAAYAAGDLVVDVATNADSAERRGARVVVGESTAGPPGPGARAPVSAAIDPSALTQLMLSVGQARRRFDLPLGARAVVRVAPADAAIACSTFAACYAAGTLDELLGGPVVADPDVAPGDLALDPIAPAAAAPARPEAAA